MKGLKKYWLLIYILLGTLCSTLSYLISANTIIDETILLIAWLSIGLFSSLVWNLLFEKKFYLRKFIGKSFLYTISIGGIILFSFLLINYSFRDKSTISVLKTEIIKKSYKRKNGRNFPIAAVKIEGINKKFSFSSRINIQDFNYIIFKLEKGFFGYSIVKSTEIKRF
jgi:hypothetical protein